MSLDSDGDGGGDVWGGKPLRRSTITLDIFPPNPVTWRIIPLSK